MLALFRSVPLVWKLLGGVAIVATVAGLVYHAGYRAGTDRAEARFAESQRIEAERQDAANEQAQRNAAQAVADLEVLRRDRDARLLALAAAAAADPDAGVCALPLAGVMRHNAFTGQPAP